MQEKKPLTIGDLKERLKSIELPSKKKVHLIAMIMAIPTWTLLWTPLLIVQMAGCILMITNATARKGSCY